MAVLRPGLRDLRRTGSGGGGHLCFQSSVVHGLLQTADYARAGHEAVMPRLDSDQIEMQIEAKLTRQRLTRDNPPRFTVVLDEAALHRLVGGRRVMAAQLDKILDMSALPNIDGSGSPLRARRASGAGEQLHHRRTANSDSGVVFVEGLIGSTYLERAEILRDIVNLQSVAIHRAKSKRHRRFDCKSCQFL